jgi:hypothetical protein
MSVIPTINTTVAGTTREQLPERGHRDRVRVDRVDQRDAARDAQGRAGERGEYLCCREPHARPLRRRAERARQGLELGLQLQWALQPIPEITVVGPQIAAQA